MKIFKPILFTALILFNIFSFEGFSSHILGGEMSYRCVGNNRYEINMKVYRDCHSGLAPFDNPVQLALYDGKTFALLNSVQFSVNRSSIKNVYNHIGDSCFSDICVESATYTTILNLSKSSNGYVVAYQRCCRGHHISNLHHPDTQGITISTNITPEALNKCNSSPTFVHDVPVVSFVNDSISFDVSGFDVDGDSLVYKLHAPLDGGGTSTSNPWGPNGPMPLPPGPPPYDTVDYESFYSSSIPFVSLTPIIYNLKSGIFSAVPRDTGTYLIGYSIEEYNRTGTLLSTTSRSIGLSIGTCKIKLDTVVNIEESRSNSSFNIFPNPFTDVLHMEFYSSKKTRYNLYSSSGVRLMHGEFKRESELNVGEIKAGIYMLELINNEGESTVKKLIKY